jgi:cytochrome c oxidase assembly protein subunit 15
MANVVLDWPLLGAMLHTAGAGGLVAVLVWMITLSGLASPIYRRKEMQ